MHKHAQGHARHGELLAQIVECLLCCCFSSSAFLFHLKSARYKGTQTHTKQNSVARIILLTGTEEEGRGRGRQGAELTVVAIVINVAQPGQRGAETCLGRYWQRAADQLLLEIELES